MLLYEGKAKQIYSTENENEFIVYFKDDATAFNGEKKAQISSKGILNNKISTILFEMLHEEQIKTHFIKKISEREMLVKKVEILPLEVIVRNITAGSFCKRYGVEEGIVLDEPIFELSYKNDAYGDPMLNNDHAVAMKLATREELEFGKDSEGNIILADEISPDTCRLWDVDTNEKLDKDRFRRDLGDLVQGYEEVLARMSN